MKDEDKVLLRNSLNFFDRDHIISDIILLGLDGAIRRIQFDVEEVKDDGT